MGVNWKILQEAREPKPEPCAKDAGCVNATSQAAHKPVVNGDLEPVVMCAWCKRIKEDGKWVEAEVFDCEITHTICLQCKADITEGE